MAGYRVNSTVVGRIVRRLQRAAATVPCRKNASSCPDGFPRFHRHRPGDRQTWAVVRDSARRTMRRPRWLG